MSADEVSIFVEGMMLRNYDYDEYITVTDEDKDDSEISLEVTCSEEMIESVTHSIQRMQQIS